MTAPEGKLEADSAATSLTTLRATGLRADSEEDCGDFGIRIDRHGTWYYRGSPIGRKPMVKLFSTVLNRRDDGTYWLTTPVENGRIEVEDVPFVAVELMHSGMGPSQEVDFRTNLDEIVPLDPDHALRVDTDAATGEPKPYIHVGKGLDARILRSVFYHLVDIGEEKAGGEEAQFGVWSRGHFFKIGEAGP